MIRADQALAMVVQATATGEKIEPWLRERLLGNRATRRTLRPSRRGESPGQPADRTIVPKSKRRKR